MSEATAIQVRNVIDNIPSEIVIENSTGLFTQKVDGNLIKTLDKFLFLSGARISEVVTLQRPCERDKLFNSGNQLTMNYAKFGGEEIAVFTITTLKRTDHIQRSVALPLNTKYERWTKDIIKEWGKSNPFNIHRQLAWKANRIVFKGLNYKVTPRLKPAIYKPISNHGLRHVRIRELIMDYNFNVLEVQRYVGWTASSIGVNTLVDTYFNLVWRDYIGKLLVEIN